MSYECATSVREVLTTLHRPETWDAVLQCERSATAAHVANLRRDAVAGARRGTDRRLALEGVKLLETGVVRNEKKVCTGDERTCTRLGSLSISVNAPEM